MKGIERKRAMKVNIQRLAGVGFGATLAIMLSVDVEACPSEHLARPHGNFRLR
jgi:hypothetical protein